MKTLSSSHVKFADLQKVVNIRQITNDALFAEWFAYDYAISKYPRTRDPKERAVSQSMRNGFRIVNDSSIT